MNRGEKELWEKPQHAVITGGSSGIGLSIAKQLLTLKQTKGKRKGNYLFHNITLMARNKPKLQSAQTELLSSTANNFTSIRIASVDVSNYEDVYNTVNEDIIPNCHPPTVLFNVAGMAMPTEFLSSDPSIFSRSMNVNYMGSVNATRVIAPHMKANGGGMVVFTSSAAGQVGVYGYSAYSPTKFALRGLAEVLHMELEPFNIRVQLVVPPNTDTPGFEKENQFKMEECRLMEDVAGLFHPDDIAKKMVKEALSPNPRFVVYFGLEGWMLSTLTCGMSSVHHLFDALCQVLLMGLLRFVSLCYLYSFRNIVTTCSAAKKKKEEEQNSSEQKEQKDEQPKEKKKEVVKEKKERGKKDK